MSGKKATTTLSMSQEDYLESILLLSQKNPQVRVKDIAAHRQVKAPSVTLALGKLSALGLVAYHPREFVELTSTGMTEAQKVYSRHTRLHGFFTEILNLPPDTAEADACALEHVLSEQGMSRLTRLFEYLRRRPSDQKKQLNAIMDRLEHSTDEGKKPK